MNKILVYHPTGNQNVRGLLRGLADRQMLHSYHTTIAVFQSSWYYKYLKGPLEKFKRRTFPESIKNNIVLYPFIETLLTLHVRKYRGMKLTGSTVNKMLAYDVAKYIKNKHKKIDAVYGFPFGSEPIFNEARIHGIKCLYEQTTGYYKSLKEITNKEKSINPDWAKSITIYEEPQEILDKLDRELSMADVIIVASSYIKKTLTTYGYNEDKIKIIPYGYPPITPKKREEKYNTERLKLLFAGNISQLKGLSYLFKSLEGLEDKVELTLVGSKTNNLSTEMNVALAKHNYLGSLSHELLLQEMHKADILVFPTLCDGYGMVVTEAMSQGTPVIASENSCGPDFIKHGINGWLVPIQNSEAIRKIIMEVLSEPSSLKRISEKALDDATQRPWSIYEKEVTDYIKSIH